jgi:oligopeptide/dipeptide ABC transporter ATP-binding protein
MYAGQIVEEAKTGDIFYHPAHPYTRALLQSVPDILDAPDRKLTSIPGMVPDNYDELTGCRFAARCSYCGEECDRPQDSMQCGDGHFVQCTKYYLY